VVLPVNASEIDAEGLGDDDLLRLISGGDRRAFKVLMSRHGRLMLALAQRTTGNAADADEVLQEALLKVWQTAWQWRPDGGAKFSSWFYRVVLNASLDRCRRKTMTPLDDVDDPEDESPSGYDQVASAQRHRMIVMAMDELPKRQKEAVTLFYFGEMSAPHAALFLGMSLSAFESLLIRGKRTLRETLRRRGIRSLGDVL